MFKAGLILACIALGCLVQEGNSAYLSVDSFFNTNGNLTIITWAQGIQSQLSLAQALNSTAMMLEGDVALGEYTFAVNETTLIMSTNVSSDLTLENFLVLVELFNAIPGNQTRKGVQLNFRNITVLNSALIPLLTTLPRLSYPVWIHTEILVGPGGLIPNIGAQDFFDLVVGFRNSTLSLAWTLWTAQTLSGLDNGHIDAMVNALQENSVDQAITFPIRADVASLSVLQVQSLAARAPQSTLTIWGDASLFNEVTFNNIRNIIINVGINRTLLVVPDNIRTTLLANLSNSAGITSLSLGCIIRACQAHEDV